MRLIVVENDPVLRKALVEVLRRDGMQILAAPTNGNDALKAVARIHPDLILTDCDMPNGTGLELVQQLRSTGDQIPIVMLSGKSDPETVAHATAVGVTRYLIKPITAELLTMALRQAFLASAA